MNRITVIQLLASGVLVLVVAGITYGMAVGWDPTDGTRVMAIAATLVFVTMAAGILLSGGLRDIGDRPEHAPSAYRAGLGASLFLMVVGCAPILLTGTAPVGQYLVWFGAHALPQLALSLFVFRRQDADEMARAGAPKAPPHSTQRPA